MKDDGMSKIVQTIASVMFPFVLIFGLYIIAHGHITPGGGFQGGAVVASALAMLLIAYGSPWILEKIKEKRISSFESLGAIGFIGTAILGLLIAGVFFSNFLVGNTVLFGTIPATGSTAADLNTGGVLPFMNFFVGLKVIAGLFAIILVMAYATSHKEGLE